MLQETTDGSSKRGSGFFGRIRSSVPRRFLLGVTSRAAGCPTLNVAHFARLGWGFWLRYERASIPHRAGASTAGHPQIYTGAWLQSFMRQGHAPWKTLPRSSRFLWSS